MLSVEVALMLSLFASAMAFAFWRGGEPERIAAAVILVWLAGDMTYHQLAGPASFDEADPIHVALDGAELMAVTWLALKANRVWPLFAAAAQLICVSGHVAVHLEPDGMRRAYWAMTQLPPLIQAVALLWGTAAHVQRFRRVGRYRSWRLA